MNILVANLGSSSFKFRLFRFGEAGDATLLAKGGSERVTDYGQAIDDCLAELKAGGHAQTAADLHGVGFKTVLGKNLTGCVRADERVIAALDGFKEIAPAHNPPYALGIHGSGKTPGVPLVTFFETRIISGCRAATRYDAAGVVRCGRAPLWSRCEPRLPPSAPPIASRADIAGVCASIRPALRRSPRARNRYVSCFGGNSSVTGIRDGVAVRAWASAQSVPHNNRSATLDSAAVPFDEDPRSLWPVGDK